MKPYWHLLLMTLALLLFCQCSRSSQEEPIVPDYNEYVSAYTSGCIPRKSEIRILLSEELSQGRMDSVPAAAVLSLSPKVEGRCTYADAHTLVFTPAPSLAPDSRYVVKVELGKLYAGAQPFEYSFETLPFAIGGTMRDFDVTEDGTYELNFNFLTADSETAKMVESHVALSLPCEQTWTHASDGTVHQLKVKIKPARDCTLQVTQVNGEGAENPLLAEVALPADQTFAVVNQRVRSGDRRCIELTFNQLIDATQEVNGLAYIQGVNTRAVVERNRILLYGELTEGETVQVFLSEKLRSRQGQTLGTDQKCAVSISGIKPAVEFVGDGMIFPQSDKILVPFRSIYMRGVRVTVFRMFANMMGNHLQHGDLDECDQLTYVGRPIVSTTFYMEGKGLDLSEWHTYAIDLTDQVKLEPGAMYRIELALDARLSAWPCDTLPRATHEEMAEEDALILQQYTADSDFGSYYYTGKRYDRNVWFPGYYDLRENPSSTYYYDSRCVGRNVLATNIGLTALKGSADRLSVTALNLPDAQPMQGVAVEAYSMQQQWIGKGLTDSQGLAEIAYDAQLGQPAYLIARKGDDVSYLKISNYLALSTSTFDVAGHVIERGLKGFIYGDRGVWRPGDTLHLAFMLNDRAKTLPDNHPVTLRLSNPLGQEIQRITRTTGAMGLYAFHLPIAADAPTGIWNAQIQVGGVTFSKNLRIETIKPNRLKIALQLPQGALTTGSNAASLHTEWLNGGTAGSLKYDVSATVIETKTGWKQYRDYVFDDPTKSFESSEQSLAKGQTGSQGDASCLLNLQAGKKAPGMLKASLVTRVYEPSGEFSVDVTQSLLAPYTRFIGLKSPQTGRQSHLDTDRDQTYHIVSVDKEGAPVGNVQVKVQVYKVDWYWWWSSSRYDMAGYTASKYNRPVRQLEVMTNAGGVGTFSLRMTEADWGTYLIVAEDAAGGHSTGLLSYFDWPWMSSRRSSDAKENATVLSLTTDKKEYAPGEKIRLSLPSDKGSRAIVSVCNGSRVLSLDTYPCQPERTEIQIEATEEMTPNVYICVSLVQPYSQTVNDMPIRMYGLVPVTVTSAMSRLNPVLATAGEFLPESKAQVTVSERDGRPMSYTLAVVDEGLLDLTHFKTPDPWQTFNAREALGTRFWDLYSHVNGAYGGRIEQLFSIGGDDALNNAPKAIVNRFRPMVYFEGPFLLKKGEKRVHKVQVPNYNGRVRVMVVAGDGQSYGSTDKSVLVRRPLMLMGTMPRQIGHGDEMTVSATLFATQPLGEVKVSLSPSQNLQVIGAATQTVRLDAAGDKTVQFRIKDTGRGAKGTVSLQATAGTHKADYTAEITVRAVSQTLRQSQTVRLEPGKTFDQTITLPGEGDYRLLYNVSAIQPLDLAGRLRQLISYPHGCAEQTTSGAFPQLYLGDFSLLSEQQQADVEQHVKDCIARLSLYQMADGGISYWPGGRQSHPWASTYVLHFLSQALGRGYFVPEELYRRLKTYVRKQATLWNEKQEAATAAYQFYVLAGLQDPVLGAMNRMREHTSELSAQAGLFLAAAYALSGRTDIGNELYLSLSQDRGEYEWFSHDVTSLLAQLALDDSHAKESAEVLRDHLASDLWLSTSECAGSLIALSDYYRRHAVGKGLNCAIQVDAMPMVQVESEKFSLSEECPLSAKQTHLVVKNTSASELFLHFTVQGTATQGEIARQDNGIELRLSYLSDENQPVEVKALRQSQTFRALLTVRNTSGKPLEHVAVTHILPAGWEILSTAPAGSIHYQDVRDDRVYSYIDHLAIGESVSIRLNLSATYVGTYYLPSVQAEAMYEATLCGCTESGLCEVVP